MNITIPTWLSVPLCVVIPWASAALFYFAGKMHRARIDKRGPQCVNLPPPIPRVMYDITINVVDKPDNLAGLESDLRKAIERVAGDAS